MISWRGATDLSICKEMKEEEDDVGVSSDKDSGENDLFFLYLYLVGEFSE
jgi:hypothetical protein